MRDRERERAIHSLIYSSSLVMVPLLATHSAGLLPTAINPAKCTIAGDKKGRWEGKQREGEKEGGREGGREGSRPKNQQESDQVSRKNELGLPLSHAKTDSDSLSLSLSLSSLSLSPDRALSVLRELSHTLLTRS